MDGLIVGLCRERGDDLHREAHPEGDSVWGKGRECAVVVAAPSSETPSAGGEGEARYEETIEGGKAHPFASDRFFEPASGVGCGLEVIRGGGCTP